MVFDHFITRNSACTLLMEVDWFGLDTAGKSANLWKYVPFLGEPLVDSYIRRNDPWKFYLWKWIPYSKYAEFNGQIGWRSVLHILRGSPSPFDDRGTYLLDGAFSVPEVDRHRAVSVAVDGPLVHALSRIVSNAHARHMNVVLYMAPEFGQMWPLWLNRPEIIDYYRSFARADRISFLLFDDLSLVNDSTSFRDAEHLSRRGALSFSAALAHELKTRNILHECT